VKNVMSFCLALLISLFPGLSLAQNKSNEDAQIAPLVDKLSRETG
jgi:hypothetical protein